jgi:hypothetical protein
MFLQQTVLTALVATRAVVHFQAAWTQTFKLVAGAAVQVETAPMQFHPTVALEVLVFQIPSPALQYFMAVAVAVVKEVQPVQPELGATVAVATVEELEMVAQLLQTPVAVAVAQVVNSLVAQVVRVL